MTDVKQLEKRLEKLETAFASHSHQVHEVDVVVVPKEEEAKKE